MFTKVILLIYVVKVSYAVFIDTSEARNKDLVKTNPQGWQMVKVYHPPTFGYKYEPYAYPKYEFEYSVSDKKTGDHKHHSEARDGDRVRGEYSLVESDGSLRKVQYRADDQNGFNAIVSKTINKHGDHAISVTDHTRFFYPVGHNVKINHYFPGKDYHYQDKIKSDDIISKPVHEEANINDKQVKMLMIESGDRLMAVEPVQFEEEVTAAPKEEATTIKEDLVEVTPVQIVPAVVSTIPEMKDENKVNPEPISSVSQVHNTDVSLAKEILPENESQSLEKDQSDSEVASSFYHSKFYYYV